MGERDVCGIDFPYKRIQDINVNKSSDVNADD